MPSKKISLHNADAKKWLKSDFDYDLPQSKIANFPLKNRDESLLLELKVGSSCHDTDNCSIAHWRFKNLTELLRPNDLLVFNNTKVIPARLFATKTTGGKVEIVVEKIVSPTICYALIKSSKKLKVDELLHVGKYCIRIDKKTEHLYLIEFSNNIKEVLAEYGITPLPPYIKRQATEDDKKSYQTVYSKIDGAIAAPTAGLHFSNSLIKKINDLKIANCELTLHVGLGTFEPIKHKSITQHKMHQEWFNIPNATIKKLANCKNNNGRIIAVGTTSMRALETLANRVQNWTELKCDYSQQTDLYIQPHFKFKLADALITNFHVPQSSLMVLVSAFAGYKNIKKAYKTALEKNYRFLSYGDAMFIHKA